MVLEIVVVLLKNYGADKAIITADHGGLFGEMGIYSLPVGILHPKLRHVLWIEVTASDKGRSC